MKFLYIYAKNKKIKVLNQRQSIEKHNSLIKIGWKHTETLDPCKYLEYLHNKCKKEHLKVEIDSLSKSVE